MNKQQLPIDSFLLQISQSMIAHPSVIIVAEPGAGKTTRVPVSLSESVEGCWIVLQPRRWAAKLTAKRIADENGFQLGREVGYQIRFENRSSRNTRILFMTEGLLLRRLVDDPELNGVAGVILDEFHERSLDADLSLAILKEIQGSLRPDLKIVIMSATLDPGPLQRYLPGSKVFDVPGRVFPVMKRYTSNPSIVNAVKSVLPDSGDVLVFLPGAYEIERAVRDLQAWVESEGPRDLDVLPLYASLSDEKQSEVFKESRRRKIICSTNIAETSITLPKIKAVVDSGLQKVMRMDPGLGLDRLETLRISKASADQRAGRAGRVSEGVVLRLWSEGEQEQLRHFETPELQRVNLGKAILMLAEFGVNDFATFDWFEKPKSSMLGFALEELKLLGFLDEQGISSAGKSALRLPLHPRIASLVLSSERAGCLNFGARLGALLDSISKEERIRDDEQLIHRLNRLTAIEKKVASQIYRSDSIPEVRMDEFDRYESVLIETGKARICINGKLVGRRRVRARDGQLPEMALLLVTLDQGEVVTSSWIPLSRNAIMKFAEKKRRVFFDEDSMRVRAVQGLFFVDLEVSPLTDVAVTEEEASRALAEFLQKDPEGYFSKYPEVESFLKRLRFAEIEVPWVELIPALVMGHTKLASIEPHFILKMMEGVLGREAVARLESFAPLKIEVPSGSMIAIEYGSDPPRVSVRLQEVFGWLETPRIAGGKVPLLLELLSPGFKPIQVTRDLKSFWANAYFEVKKELKARYPKHSWPEDPLTARPEAKGRRRS